MHGYMPATGIKRKPELKQGLPFALKDIQYEEDEEFLQDVNYDLLSRNRQYTQYATPEASESTSATDNHRYEIPIAEKQSPISKIRLKNKHSDKKRYKNERNGYIMSSDDCEYDESKDTDYSYSKTKNNNDSSSEMDYSSTETKNKASGHSGNNGNDDGYSYTKRKSKDRKYSDTQKEHTSDMNNAQNDQVNQNEAENIQSRDIQEIEPKELTIDMIHPHQTYDIPMSDQDEFNVKTLDEYTLIDLMLDCNFSMFQHILNDIDNSRYEFLAKASLDAAILSNKTYSFFARMVEIEVETLTMENKSTIFKGNAVPALVIGAWPKIVARKWLTTVLRPAFDFIIAFISQGDGFVVNPAKLPPGQNLEHNKQNFRVILTKCVQSILDGQVSLPETLVYAAQIIVEKVCKKLGECSYSILSSFIFVKFIIPAFSATQLVGYPPITPGPLKDALIQTAAIIVASVLKGNLDDKGPYFEPYNDFAKWTYDSINQMYREIVTKDVLGRPPNVKVDELKTIVAIHTEAWPIINKLEQEVKQMIDATESANGQLFIAMLRAMGPPPYSGKILQVGDLKVNITTPKVPSMSEGSAPIFDDDEFGNPEFDDSDDVFGPPEAGYHRKALSYSRSTPLYKDSFDQDSTDSSSSSSPQPLTRKRSWSIFRRNKSDKDDEKPKEVKEEKAAASTVTPRIEGRPPRPDGKSPKFATPSKEVEKPAIKTDEVNTPVVVSVAQPVDAFPETHAKEDENAFKVDAKALHEESLTPGFGVNPPAVVEREILQPENEFEISAEKPSLDVMAEANTNLPKGEMLVPTIEVQPDVEEINISKREVSAPEISVAADVEKPSLDTPVVSVPHGEENLTSEITTPKLIGDLLEPKVDTSKPELNTDEFDIKAPHVEANYKANVEEPQVDADIKAEIPSHGFGIKTQSVTVPHNESEFEVKLPIHGVSVPNVSSSHNENFNVKVESPRTEFSTPNMEYTAPKMEFSAPQAEVSSSKIEFSTPKTEYTAPKSEFSVPSAEISSPKTEFTEPKSEFSTPSAGISAPKTEFSTPNIEYSAPKTEFCVPSAEYTAPKAGFSVPSAEYSAPKSEFSTPSADILAPKTEFSSPNSEYTYPKIEFSTPKPEVSTPKSDLSALNTEYIAPKAEFSVPQAEYSAPKSEFSTPSAEYSAPKTEFSAPNLEYTAPKSEFSVPKVEHPQLQTEFSTPKIEMAELKSEFSAPKAEFSPPKTVPNVEISISTPGIAIGECAELHPTTSIGSEFNVKSPNIVSHAAEISAPELSTNLTHDNAIDANIEHPQIEFNAPKPEISSPVHDSGRIITGLTSEISSQEIQIETTELSAPQIKANSRIDINEQNADFKAPHSEISVPGFEANIPRGRAGFEIESPHRDIKTEMPEVSVPGFGEPRLEVAPKSEISIPEFEEPKTDVSIPQIGLDANINAPSLSAPQLDDNYAVNITEPKVEDHKAEFSVPGFDANAPHGGESIYIKAEALSTRFEGPRLDINAPKVEISSPEFELNESIESPKADFSMPTVSASIKAPMDELSTPAIDVPHVNAIAPKSEISMPEIEELKTDISAPRIEIDSPNVSAQIKAPTGEISAPSFEEPHVDVVAPKTEFNLNENIEGPKTDISAPRIDAFNIGIDTPSVSAPHEDAQFKLNTLPPKIDFNAPKTEMSAPDVNIENIKTPSVEVPTQEIDIVSPQDKIGFGAECTNPTLSVQKPEISVPEIDIKSPSVSIPHGEVMPTAVLPELSANVEVPKVEAPKTDVFMPGLDVKAPHGDFSADIKPPHSEAVDLNAPNTDITLPHPHGEAGFGADVDALVTEISTQEIRIPEKSIGGENNMPVIDVSMPSVCAPHREAGFGLDVDVNAPKGEISTSQFEKPSFNAIAPLPEPPSEIDINAPSVSVTRDIFGLDDETPSINVPETEFHHEERAGFGIDTPAAQFSPHEIGISELPKAESPKVDVFLPELGLIAAQPSLDLNALSVTAPPAESNFGLDLSAPSVELNTPKIESPKTDIFLPELGLNAPSVSAPPAESGFGIELTTPNAELNAPEVFIPELGLNSPSISAPPANSTIGADLNAPKGDVFMPELGIIAPKAEASAPEIPAFDDVSVDTPKLNFNASEFNDDATGPRVEISQPEIGFNAPKAQTPSSDVSAQNISAPHREADFNLNHETHKLDIYAPKVEVSQPLFGFNSNIEKPTTELSGSETGLDDNAPKINATAPFVGLPELSVKENIEVPKDQAILPEIAVIPNAGTVPKSPSTDINAGFGADIISSGLGFDNRIEEPSIAASMPEISTGLNVEVPVVSTPELGIDANAEKPEISFNTPAVSSSQIDASVSKPGFGFEAPHGESEFNLDVDINAPKTDISTPGFGINGPNIVARDIVHDEADFEMAAEKPSIDINAPSDDGGLDVNSPKIGIKSPKLQAGGESDESSSSDSSEKKKKRKWNIFKRKMKSKQDKAKVKGDINIPTPDVNVEIPKAEVSAPEISAVSHKAKVDAENPSSDFNDPEIKSPSVSTPHIENCFGINVNAPEKPKNSAPDFDADIKADKPHINTRSPEAEFSTPVVDINAPNVSAQKPYLDFNAPNISAPHADAAFDVNPPKAEISTPSLDINESIEVPKPEITMASVSKPHLDSPEAKMSAPEIEINTPSVSLSQGEAGFKHNIDHVSSPKAEISTPGISTNFETPKAENSPIFDANAERPNLDTPMAEVSVPGIGINPPNVSAPKVETGLDIDVNVPKVAVRVPKSRASDEESSSSISSEDKEMKRKWNFFNRNEKATENKISSPGISGKVAANVEVPKVEAKSSEAEISAPDIAMGPPHGTGNFEVNAEKPTIDINAPKAEISTPSIGGDINAPKADITVPSTGDEFGISKPHLDVNAPKAEIKVPSVSSPHRDVDIKAPNAEISASEISSINTPQSNISTAGLDVIAEKPSLDVNAPSVSSPHSEPNIDINAPKADVSAPKIESPKIDVKVPKSRASNEESSDSSDDRKKKHKWDFFKRNKKAKEHKADLNVSSPELSGKADLHVDATRAEISAPEKVPSSPKTEISTPSIGGGVAMPSVDIKSPKANIEAPKAEIQVNSSSPHDININAPKADFTVPSTGDEFSISKPHLDVNAPKAEIKVPSVSSPRRAFVISAPQAVVSTPEIAKINAPKVESPKSNISAADLEADIKKSSLDVDAPKSRATDNESDEESSSSSSVSSEKKKKCEWNFFKRNKKAKEDKISSADKSGNISTNVEAPKAEFSTPSIGDGVAMPYVGEEVNIDIPHHKANIEESKAEIKVDDSSQHGKADSPMLDANINAPKAEISTPSVSGSVKARSVKERKVPAIDINQNIGDEFEDKRKLPANFEEAIFQPEEVSQTESDTESKSMETYNIYIQPKTSTTKPETPKTPPKTSEFNEDLEIPKPQDEFIFGAAQDQVESEFGSPKFHENPSIYQSPRRFRHSRDFSQMSEDFERTDPFSNDSEVKSRAIQQKYDDLQFSPEKVSDATNNQQTPKKSEKVIDIFYSPSYTPSRDAPKIDVHSPSEQKIEREEPKDKKHNKESKDKKHQKHKSKKDTSNNDETPKIKDVSNVDETPKAKESSNVVDTPKTSEPEKEKKHHHHHKKHHALDPDFKMESPKAPVSAFKPKKKITLNRKYLFNDEVDDEPPIKSKGKETSKPSTPVASAEKKTTQKTKKFSELPKKTTEEPKKIVKEVKKVKEEPKTESQITKKATEEPKKVTVEAKKEEPPSSPVKKRSKFLISDSSSDDGWKKSHKKSSKISVSFSGSNDDRKKKNKSKFLESDSSDDGKRKKKKSISRSKKTGSKYLQGDSSDE